MEALGDVAVGEKILDRAGLAEVFDAKSLQAATIDTTEPTECGGMSATCPHNAVRSILAILVLLRIELTQPFINSAADCLGFVFLQEMDAVTYECCVDVLEVLDHPIWAGSHRLYAAR